MDETTSVEEIKMTLQLVFPAAAAFLCSGVVREQGMMLLMVVGGRGTVFCTTTLLEDHCADTVLVCPHEAASGSATATAGR